ncbi:MAG: hypothetical protein LJE89_06295 [Deltaproteobacteria bacterium]|nr:hypothetical protein [Deltaproteobacteria bacterium]
MTSVRKKALIVFVALLCCLFVAATHYASAQPPVNDLCENAIGPLSITVGENLVQEGKTIDATFDDVGDCGEFNDNTAPGVWYRVVGTGTKITASTCGSPTNYDTKISVFCGSCEELICIDGNDDGCPNKDNALQSTVSWCSQEGAEYLILVHGFESAVGDFELSLSADDGKHCEPELKCIPVGACCLSNASCQDSYTQAECDRLGGLYQGDDTLCQGGFLYHKEGLDNPLEDIYHTGNKLELVSSCDDCGEEVPIGFPFNFYGDTHQEIKVSSNGYLTFGDDLEDFTNDRVPYTTNPNDLIAPYWDDWIPSEGGAIHYQTMGETPNRRFIAQWTKVKHYDVPGKSTFQAILFEGSDCIEFRYGNLAPVSPTIGIENQDGTKGIDVTTDESKGFRFCPEPLDPIECSLEVSLDIKPRSCPNKLNTKSRLFITAAILGSEYFDVREVDILTIELEGVAPLRSNFRDVATPFLPMVGKVDCEEDCNNLGSDGFMDLTLQFDTQEIVRALGEVEDGQCLTLQLTGKLLDGTPIVGEDVVVIIKRGRPWFKKDKTKKKGKKFPFM